MVRGRTTKWCKAISRQWRSQTAGITVNQSVGRKMCEPMPLATILEGSHDYPKARG